MSTTLSRLLPATLLLPVLACAPEDQPTAPSFAKGGTAQLTTSVSALEFTLPPGGSASVTITAQYVTTISGADAACAAVTPTSLPTKKEKGSSAYMAEFSIAATSVGDCTVTFQDKNGKAVTVAVSVLPPLPDRVVYTSDAHGNSELFVMDLDGGNPTRLTSTGDFELFPTLSADGRKILFVSTTGSDWVPSLMAVDGTGRTALPLVGARGTPWLSPSGQRVVYTANVDGLPRLFASDLDGGNMNQLTSGGGAPTEGDPSWSGALPGRIAFLREAARNIWVMNADGTGQAQVTADNDPWLHSTQGLALSPDGQKIAFACQPTTHVFDICIINVDGTGRTQLTTADGDDVWPRWTRDGRIVFTSERDGNQEVYIMNADGTGQTNLTNSAANESTGAPS